MNPLLVILGPTASGKTHLATRVCHVLGGEIISADSRQVYRDMDIGTGKDLNEYVVEGKPVNYHLINIREPGAQYNVHEFQSDFERTFNELSNRNSLPVLCGGTGFYIHSVIKGHAFSTIPKNETLRAELEPLQTDELKMRFEKYATIYNEFADTSTKKRLVRAIEISEYLLENPEKNHAQLFKKTPLEAVIFGLNPNVEQRRRKISERLHFRLQNGLVEEVEGLLRKGLTSEQLIYYGLEYKWITLYLLGNLDYKEMVQRLETEIHRFAKRQMTFFRKMEKDGLKINWLDPHLSVNEQVRFITNTYQPLKSRYRQ